MTLILHGDLIATSLPHLQALLEDLVLLQPGCLRVDLSDVGKVNREAFQMMERCGIEIGAFWLISPSPQARRDLENLGCLGFIDPDLAPTASGVGNHSRNTTIEEELICKG